MSTINGTTHIKTIFSFSPGTGEHSTPNALCNYGDSLSQFTRILHVFHVKRLLQTPTGKNPEEPNLEN
jgi:hypothetical protein